jgi:putative transposase
MSRAERVALIERDGELPLSVQAALLGVSRSGLYYRPVAPSLAEVKLKHRIDELYTENPFYGSRRITAQLRREEFVVNRKAVQRHMREMGIVAIGPKPNLSKPHPEHRIYPYLLGDVVASFPDQVWGIDLTYVRLAKGWLYLVAILDWFSRFVVAWELDQTLELDFVLAAVDRALGQATPRIWNSDQGSHFTSPRYLDRLLARDIQISMDGKGRALDNVFVERLWRSVKYEEVYLADYDSPRAAHRGLSRYFEFYNHRRPHQALDYRTPAEVYFARPAPTPALLLTTTTTTT